ncbi:AAA family ATPase [Psychroflexus sp. CAK57W]|uniref:ATP-binding protein n=1 Tax=Psychroflexus curvus TaxID=2873595 RepID=UPI001CCE3182|nr:AAA family ATPase [Psychroflexus curvus]MBZ9786716.1 AAA family ATPase [Psychroflexus curvus]
MESLFEYSNKFIKETDLGFMRYMHAQINWDNRLIGLLGARGVGKTTLVLQHIKKNLPQQQTLYVTAEDFYFSSHSLVDLASEFVKYGGKHLIIDEIHKYPEWSKALKLIYDYHKDLQVVFTGSSVLDIKKGSADLSRRAVMYHMKGLSFREYLSLFHHIDLPTYTLDEVLSHKVEAPQLPHPLALFSKYLKQGYYPFSLEADFDIRLKQIINQSLEVDIPVYAGMNVATGRKLKQLLAIISRSVPFKPNRTKIAELLGASRNNILDYLLYIEEAGMIGQLRPSTGGIRGLGKVDKIYLDNTNLIYSLTEGELNTGNLRETFFFNQLSQSHIVTSSKGVDFKIGHLHFEVGGKSKGKKQLKGLDHAFLVKDDIEAGYLNTIPLWQFGLLY